MPSSNPEKDLFYYEYLAPRFVPVNNNFGTLGTRRELTGIQARLGTTTKVVQVSLLEFGVGSQQTIEIGVTGIPPQGNRADGRSGVQIMEPGIFVRDAG